MRYQFYREHKFVSAAMNDLERKIATFDVNDERALKEVQQSFAELAEMLHQHAAYENERIHRLLMLKRSGLQHSIENEHEEQERDMAAIAECIDALFVLSGEEKIKKGYEFYLRYRKFLAEMLLHLHEEETVLLPELQRLYTDRELAQVAEIAYKQMQPEDIVAMVRGLFPHMNNYDRQAFLRTMHMLVPQKFFAAWPKISELLPVTERDLAAFEIIEAHG